MKTSDVAKTDKHTIGILETDVGDKHMSLLRDAKVFLAPRPSDVIVPREMINQYRLRPGVTMEVTTEHKRGAHPMAVKLISVDGVDPEEYGERVAFDDFVVIDPNEQLVLATGAEPLGTRAIDLLCPIGKGQRGLIVAPPRTGKTILLTQIAHGVRTNDPKSHLMILLLDERPEEVTDIRRKVDAEVFASSNDHSAESHIRLAKLALERAKRLVEGGRDVVILLDSLTRLGRAHNNAVRSSGRTMSGGLDIRAMQVPKQIFGAARNAENGGSLTIIATALIDTGSRMDEIIFQEFKGTGNMELVLDQQLANRRVYPAIDIQSSGTRKEELLLDAATLDKLRRLRGHLNTMAPGQDMEMLLTAMKKFPSNAAFMESLP